MALSHEVCGEIGGEMDLVEFRGSCGFYEGVLSLRVISWRGVLATFIHYLVFLVFYSINRESDRHFRT